MSDHPRADSAGIPWAGRALGSTGFENDAGTADPVLVAAVRARAACPSAEADGTLFRAVRTARWLVPVVAMLGEMGEAPRDGSGHGLRVEKSVDMAVVTLTGPDGRRALPAFTSVQSLAAWDPAARPVPVSADRMAQAAVAEGCQVVVVDVAADEVTELRPSMVWALAQGGEWQPAHLDPIVAQAVSRAASDEADIGSHRVEEGEPVGSGILRLVLGLRPGLDATQVEQVATRVAEQLATDGEFRARVDELTFTIEAAPIA
ncbi:SseB family protein [Lapillicoccus sp.]|uniref:SseB family protein n=1 Tax=Lapillicoccus sp. TaxID=1909287 RepID=UPI003267F87B